MPHKKENTTQQNKIEAKETTKTNLQMGLHLALTLTLTLGLSLGLSLGNEENSNHKLGIYLRSVNDYHLKCARLPPKNQLLEKAQPTTNTPFHLLLLFPSLHTTIAEGVKGSNRQHMFFMPELSKWMSERARTIERQRERKSFPVME